MCAVFINSLTCIFADFAKWGIVAIVIIAVAVIVVVIVIVDAVIVDERHFEIWFEVFDYR
jgi:hypothetical protein